MGKALVAKSYENLEQLCEPYIINNKEYVKVRMKSGATKQVRSYSETEYCRLYPNANITTSPRTSQRDTLGFGEAGYITIFKGNVNDCEEWFRTSNARYARPWGWYVISSEEVPNPLPYGIEPITLYWSLVSENDILISEDKIAKIVEELLYPVDTTKSFIGEIGERATYILQVDKVTKSENIYGISYYHKFSDSDGNIFTWSTNTKALNEGATYSITGTIKEHKKIKSDYINVLTRCKAVLIV